MEETRQYDLIARYLAGELDEAEQLLFEQWLGSSPQNKALVEEVRLIWENAHPEAVVFDVQKDNAWQKFEANMNWEAKASNSSNQETPVVSINKKRTWWGIAAAIALLAVVGFLLYQNTTPHTDSWQMVATIDGTQQEVTLPDGSIITLNENSQLSYAPNFKENRQLVLKGEAFFDVARDEQHPFTIVSGKTLTTVLGTSFNIRAYPQENYVDVHVASGRVSFAENTSRTAPLILEKGQTGILDKKAWVLEKEMTPQTNHLAWKTKKLNFENTPIHQILMDLKRTYDISYTPIDKRLGNCRFTGNFTDADLGDITKALEFALNLSIDQQQNNLTITGEGCNE